MKFFERVFISTVSKFSFHLPSQTLFNQIFASVPSKKRLTSRVLITSMLLNPVVSSQSIDSIFAPGHFLPFTWFTMPTTLLSYRPLVLALLCLFLLVLTSTYCGTLELTSLSTSLPSLNPLGLSHSLISFCEN